jgi:predicted nucleic acid-binding protein
VITIYEVFKVVLRETSENEALQAVVAMQKGRVIDLSASLAVAASRLSLEHQLPMADGIILATAQEFKAMIWTQDSDFRNISKVKYYPKK